MKAKEVWLWTNRTVSVFDNLGEQIGELQAILSETYSYGETLENALLSVIESPGVKFYMVRWDKWRHEIRPDEFCCLLGKGKWYFEYKASKILDPIQTSIFDTEDETN